MKLTLEKDLKVAVEINGQNIVNFDNGILYQHLDEVKGDMFLYIKSNDGNEVKIRIAKTATVIDDETVEI